MVDVTENDYKDLKKRVNVGKNIVPNNIHAEI